MFFKKISQNAGLQYNLAANTETECFLEDYTDPTTNADLDKEKENWYNKNLHILKHIAQVVKLS